MTFSSGVRRTGLIAVTAVLAATALAACGSDDTTSDSSKKKDGVSQISVQLVSGSNGDECKVSDTTADAGPITFSFVNKSATALTEAEVLSGTKIIGEKENLAPGLPESTLTLTLGGGDYTIYCPGAASEKTTLTVTGKASGAPSGTAAQLLQQGATEYAGYVTTQLTSMVTAVENLKKVVDSGDVAAAQKSYGLSRPFYEKVESDIEGFVLDGFAATDNHGSLDYLIDMRASSLDPAVGWSGFHAVERDLFKNQKITAQTKQYAADLVTNTTKLADLAKTLTYKPEDLANGAAGLLEEVQANKVSGEEEAFSHIDLVDFAGNVEGAQQAFEALKPGLTEIDATLTSTIEKRFTDVDALLETYRDQSAIGGYKRYTPALKATDANKLSQSVQALQDSLSRLAEKVATA
jgi:iron uptake system component EfeO